jgi:type II secretory pathway component PulM
MTALLPFLMLGLLGGLMFAIWWIPRSIRIQQIEFAIQQGKDAIAELELQLQNGEYADTEEAQQNIASLKRAVQRLKAKL